MQSQVTRPHRTRPATSARRLLLMLAGLCALAAGGTALAASSIVPSTFTTRTGTLWQFLTSNSSPTQGPTCYRSSARPDQSYNCLKLALTTSGLATGLQGTTAVTLFAPTDAGFAELARLMGPARFNALMGNAAALRTVLKDLMVAGRYTSADLRGRAVPATGRLSLPTLGGNELLLTFDRFPRGAGRVEVAVGQATFQPAWQPYLSGQTTLLDNGSIIPMDMVLLPTELR